MCFMCFKLSTTSSYFPGTVVQTLDKTLNLRLHCPTEPGFHDLPNSISTPLLLECGVALLIPFVISLEERKIHHYFYSVSL